MKIYTRRGDRGETDLLGGPRVAKDHARVEAYGAVDELNAALGACVAALSEGDLRTLLCSLQESLFELGGYLASPDPEGRAKGLVAPPLDSDVSALESRIDELESELEPLRRFVLPGGTSAAAALHLARTVCRRAERRVVSLQREVPEIAESAVRFLNRLSDLLFVLARVANRRAGVPELEWAGRRR